MNEHGMANQGGRFETVFLDETQNIGGHGRVVMGSIMRRFTMVTEVLGARCRQLLVEARKPERHLTSAKTGRPRSLASRLFVSVSGLTGGARFVAQSAGYCGCRWVGTVVYLLSPLLFFFDPKSPWRNKIGCVRWVFVGGSWQSNARDTGLAAEANHRRLGCGCRSEPTRATWRNMTGLYYAADLGSSDVPEY